MIVVPNAIYMENAFDSLLEDRTFIFFDMRKRGRSARVLDREKLARGVHHDVEDIEAVRRHLNVEQVDVIGHSYLGYVVALYAMKHPTSVRRVVQLSPMQSNFATQYPTHLANVDAVARQVFAALGQLRSKPPSGDPIDQCRQAWRILKRLYVADEADAEKIADWRLCHLKNERTMLRHLNEVVMPSVRAPAVADSDFAKATMPTLITHGDKDRSAPYGGACEWAMQLPNARLVTLSGVAHVPWLEAPELTLKAIDTFLRGAWPAETEIVKSLSATATRGSVKTSIDPNYRLVQHLEFIG